MRIYAILFYIIVVSSLTCVAQTVELTNNPFSPNPSLASSTNGASTYGVPQTIVKDQTTISRTNAAAVNTQAEHLERRPSNSFTPPVRPSDPMEYYLVGPGDILFVSIENIPTSRGYYSVRPDGTIDLPMVGASVNASGRTAAEIAFDLRRMSTVFADRNVEVKVREYSSHRITVSGLVERSGDRFLQREAMPFFAIRAESGVDRRSTHVIIRKSSDSVPEVVELTDARLDKLSVTAVMSFDFVAENQNAAAAVYVSGEVANAGKFELTADRTLSQLIRIAGGVRNGASKATVRRAAPNGTMSTQQFDLKEIAKGKRTDPILTDGDIVEIKK